MSGLTVGNFWVDVSGPYPCWVEIRCESFPEMRSMRFRHDELDHLRFALDQAAKECRALLKDDRDEVNV